MSDASTQNMQIRKGEGDGREREREQEMKQISKHNEFNYNSTMTCQAQKNERKVCWYRGMEVVRAFFSSYSSLLLFSVLSTYSIALAFTYVIRSVFP
jgi:hypothetical protein